MIFRSRFPDVAIPDVSLSDYVLSNARSYGDRPALIDGPSGRTLTYADFVTAVDRRGGTTSGGALLELKADKDGVTAKRVYRTADLANHHGGVVLVGESLYGTNNTNLVCLDFKTGKLVWQRNTAADNLTMLSNAIQSRNTAPADYAHTAQTLTDYLIH